MLRAVLFDAVGTLFEVREAVGETYARAAATHGVVLPAWRIDDAFRRVLGRAEPMVFPDVPEAEIPAREKRWWRATVRATFLAADSTSLARFDDFDALFETLWQHYASADAWQLRPGARDAVSRIARSGFGTGVVSNFDHRLDDVLEGLGIAREFSVVSIPSRTRLAKPDPGVFQFALAQLGARADEAAYVGHDPAIDARAARAAGLHYLDVDEPAGDAPDPNAHGPGLATLPARIAALAKLVS